jgi:hypothetical protein
MNKENLYSTRISSYVRVSDFVVDNFFKGKALQPSLKLIKPHTAEVQGC